MTMAKRESITFLGQEYRSIKNPDRKRVDAVYVRGKVRIPTFSQGIDGDDWEAYLDYDNDNVQIMNQRSNKKFRTEAAALRDLETNARKFLRALGVEI